MATKRTTSKKIKKNNSLWARLFGQSRRVTLVVFVIVFGGIGAYLIITGNAAPLYGPIAGIGGKCLDNYKEKTVDYNKIDLFKCNNTIAQQWRYNPNGTITNVNGDCLDVRHSGTTLGTHVDLYSCNGTVAQQWVVDPGAGTITNPHSNMCLDDKQAITTNGNQIQIWSCLKDKQQQWAVSSGAIKPAAKINDASEATITTCKGNKAIGPFTVDRTNIIDGDNQVFVPYGATLSTPEYYPGTYFDSSQNKNQSTLAQTKAQIKAIADNWCGNTVRLQVEQDELVGVDGKSYNSAYMGYLKSIVSYAENLGLSVVINAQTEPGGASNVTENEPLPTTVTEVFWHDMDKVYARDPLVVYDIFNEPRPNAFYSTAQPQTTYWNDWQSGGTFTYSYNGQAITINGLGEQALADYIRHDGSKNLLWVEGLDLGYMAANPTTYLIKGDGPIVYEYHHTTNDGVTRTPANWDAQFGSLVKDNIAPVVDGEWTNYSNNTGYTASNGDSGECWSDAPTAVPAYLDYLQNLGIGMTIWTLGGFMTTAPGNYTTPNQINASTWACQKGLNQGAGQDVQNWFMRQNS